MSRTTPAAGEAMPCACHACDRSFPTLAALRVHAVLDERRVLTPAEQAGSAQLSLYLQEQRQLRRSGLLGRRQDAALVEYGVDPQRGERGEAAIAGVAGAGHGLAGSRCRAAHASSPARCASSDAGTHTNP